MPLEVKHTKVSEKSDGQDTSLIQPSHWNAAHQITVPGERLVGRAQGTEGDAEPILIGAGLDIDAGTKTLSSVEPADVAVGTAPAIPATMPNHRVFTDTGSVQWDKATANQIKANLVPGGVTPAHLEIGVEGEILVYGESGVAERLAPGLAGQALISGGATEKPHWGNSGAPGAVLQSRRNSGVDDGGTTGGIYQIRYLNSELYDSDNIVTLGAVGGVDESKFKLAAGTYVVQFYAPCFGAVGKHQARLRQVTDGVTVSNGSGSSASGAAGATSASMGICQFTVAEADVDKQYAIQHRVVNSVANNGFGEAAGFGEPEVYTQVYIWRVG